MFNFENFNFSKRERIILLGLVALVVVLASLLIYQQYQTRADFDMMDGLSMNGQDNSAGDLNGETKQETTVTVHVCGAVKNPGVYKLSSTKRVIDAVEAAGGATAQANLNAINLAAQLKDGQQVPIPVQNPAMPQPSGTSGSQSAGSTANTGTASQTININSADLNTLKQLPGIGDVLAQRIIDYRTEHGMFNSVDELKNVSGIGEKKFADLKDAASVY